MKCLLLTLNRGLKNVRHRKILDYCKLDPKEHISTKFHLKLKHFHSWKWIWNVLCEMAAILHPPECVNSSPPSASYMPQWTGSALVQIMACRLDGNKPLSEPMLTYCQLKSQGHISMTFYLKFKYFHSRKCNWNWRLRNSGNFVSGSMS